MPVFIFRCPKCHSEQELITSVKTKEVECEMCDAMAVRQLPRKLTTTSYEMRDPHRGVQLPKGHEQSIKKRMREHHDQHELIEKIDKHGIDDAIKFGWDKKLQKTKKG